MPHLFFRRENFSRRDFKLLNKKYYYYFFLFLRSVYPPIFQDGTPGRLTTSATFNFIFSKEKNLPIFSLFFQAFFIYLFLFFQFPNGTGARALPYNLPSSGDFFSHFYGRGEEEKEYHAGPTAKGYTKEELKKKKEGFFILFFLSPLLLLLLKKKPREEEKMGNKLRRNTLTLLASSRRCTSCAPDGLVDIEGFCVSLLF